VPATPKAIARAFAPRLRFNAFVNDGKDARWNRNEDHFPMGVASLFRELASGQAWVVTQPSLATAAPSIAELRPVSAPPAFAAAQLGPYPERMVGDPPGQAPVYVHVYEEPGTRQVAPDGSGEVVDWVEYWLFYAYDRSEADVIGLVASPSMNLGGHRGDWEHIALRLRVRLGPGGVLAGGDIEEAQYFEHLGGVSLDPGELERLDDAGRPDANGPHPVVYVAQGKHASYPQAGEWPGGGNFPTWAVQQTDYFRGNGVVVDSWTGAFVDLEDPTGDAAELDPPELQAAAARGGLALGDLTAYAGRWGPDLLNLSLPFVGGLQLGSPVGPRQHGCYGDHGASTTRRWADVKRTSPELLVYRDRGIPVPDVVPAPVPIRR
jgi:hypothetical protein